MALDRWEHLAETHQFALTTEGSHHWIYRGQIIPVNQKIEVEAVVTRLESEPIPTICANGFLKVNPYAPAPTVTKKKSNSTPTLHVKNFGITSTSVLMQM